MQLPQELPPDTVYLAVSDCDWIGRRGRISINGDAWEPMIAFDCAGSQHAYRWMVDNGIIGEMDFFSAERHGVICRCGVPGEIQWVN
jgi:hypothetical protein